MTPPRGVLSGRPGKPARLLTLVLAAACIAAPPGRVQAAEPRDLVRATATLALADEPPPTYSQVQAQKERERADHAEADKKKRTGDTPYYKKWWFWALTAAVVGGTVALGAWAIEPVTVPARACSAGVIGCFGDGRSPTR